MSNYHAVLTERPIHIFAEQILVVSKILQTYTDTDDILATPTSIYRYVTPILPIFIDINFMSGFGNIGCTTADPSDVADIWFASVSVSTGLYRFGSVSASISFVH